MRYKLTIVSINVAEVHMVRHFDHEICTVVDIKHTTHCYIFVTNFTRTVPFCYGPTIFSLRVPWSESQQCEGPRVEMGRGTCSCCSQGMPVPVDVYIHG